MIVNELFDLKKNYSIKNSRMIISSLEFVDEQTTNKDLNIPFVLIKPNRYSNFLFNLGHSLYSTCPPVVSNLQIYSKA